MSLARLAVPLACLTIPLYAADQPTLVVRHEHYFVVVGAATEAEAPPTITARSKSYYRYIEGLSLQVIDDQAEVRLETVVPLGGEMSEAIPGPAAPFYLVIANPGYNGVIFDADRPWGVVAAGGRGLGTNGPVPQLYLYVPPECEAFKVTCDAPSPNEGGRVTILDPDGTEALVMDGEFDKAATEEIGVPAQQRGKVWSFTWAKPQTVKANLDDIAVSLDGYLAPLLWPNPSWAEKHGPTIWQRQKAVLDAKQQ